MVRKILSAKKHRATTKKRRTEIKTRATIRHIQAHYRGHGQRTATKHKTFCNCHTTINTKDSGRKCQCKKSARKTTKLDNWF